MTHYETLGIDRDADAAAIKSAYRAKVMEAHPDRAGGSEAAMKAVQEAYECLADPVRRTAYDVGAKHSEEVLEHTTRGIVATIFSEVIDNDPIDAVMQVCMRLNSGVEVINVKLRDAQSKRKKLSVWRRRIACAAGHENVAELVVDDKIHMIEVLISELTFARECNVRGLEMMRSYHDAGEAADAAVQRVLGLHFSGADS